MPIYSLTRTTQYTTVSQLQNLANQKTCNFDGYPQHAYASSFTATLSIICPTANRLWDYSNQVTPVSHYVWYPYSMTMAACGGGVYYPNTGGTVTYRPGYAYFKLYNSGGTFLMGSSSTTLTVHNPNNVIIINGPNWYLDNPVLATTLLFDNSRNTLTITGNTTYVAGLANTTTTNDWTIIAETTSQANQNVYTDTGVTKSGNMVLNPLKSGDCQLGFITYNNAPVIPSNVIFTSISNGISVTYQGNEANSISTGSVGAVVSIRFFYSTSANGNYTYFGTDTSISRTLISGTTYQYSGSFSGGSILQQGVYYYFKVASVNDICIQYQIENPTSIPSGEISAVQSLPIQYGNANFVNVYNGTSWNAAPIYVYDGSKWVSKPSSFAKSDGVGGWIYN
jgi:hypothetical protein